MRRNASLIGTQLKASENSLTKPKVWRRFQGYTRLIVLGGGGPKGNPDAKKPA